MTIPRQFAVHYNPYTQTIEVVDGDEQIINIIRSVRSESNVNRKNFSLKFLLDDMDIVLDALRKSEVPISSEI